MALFEFSSYISGRRSSRSKLDCLNGFSLEPVKLEKILPLAFAYDTDIIGCLLGAESLVPTDADEMMAVAVEFSDAYSKSGLTMECRIIDPDFHERTVQFAQGVFGPSQWESNERIPFPGAQQFVADFKHRTGRLPSYHASAAYTASQILEQAVQDTRSLNHRKIRDFIIRLDRMTIIGRFKVDKSGRQIGHNPVINQWQNGRKEIVYPFN